MDENFEDSFQAPKKDFQLFKAYREGQLDLDVLSTPAAITTKANNNNTDAKPVLPRSPNSKDPGAVPKSWSSSGESTKVTQGSNNITCSIASISPLMNDEISSNITIKSLNSGSGNAILVNQRQRGNPVLRHIRNVAWEYAEIEPDYVVGRNNCVYFLSSRYHTLNPEYIFERLKQTKTDYQLRVLLCQIDVPDPYYSLKELCKLCLTEGMTLMLAWNIEEASRYLESYKALENKPPDSLMSESAPGTDHPAQVTDFLTSVKRVTKTDALTIMNKFDNIAELIKCDQKTIENCPGFGVLKAHKIQEIFTMPFKRKIE